MKRFGVIALALTALLVAAQVSGGKTTTTRAQEAELGNIFALNPSVCLALQGAAGLSSCKSFAFESAAVANSIAIGGLREGLITNIDDIQGNDDGVIERSELAGLASFTGTHIHTKDGSLVVMVFVDDDDPVKFETTAGTFLVNPNPLLKAKEFVCGGPPDDTLRGDEDCDHDGIGGDGVLFAQLLGNGEPIGTKGRVTAYSTVTGEVFGDFFFDVVGEADDISLGAFETTVGGALPDVNGDTVVRGGPGGDCPLPGGTAGFLAAINDPNRTVIFGRVQDRDGQNIIGAWVEWSTDNPELGIVAAPQTPTLNLGSFGFGAPQVFCGLGGAGTVKVKGKIVVGPAGLTMDPVIQQDDFELEITLLGKPTTMNLTVTPAVLNCDGVASATVSANVLTAAGEDAANGTAVAWSVQVLGTASPLASTVGDGKTKTQVTPFAASDTGVPVIASVGPKTLIKHPLETVNDGSDDDGDTFVDDRGTVPGQGPAEFDADIDIVVPNPDYFEASTLVQCGAGSGAAPAPGGQAGAGGTAPGGTIAGPDTGTGGDIDGRGALGVWPAVALLVAAMGLAGARFGLKRAR